MTLSPPRPPWLHSPSFDLLFFLSPLYLSSMIVLASAPHLGTYQISPWLWLLLVVGIDVTHVYATLYRTYFDRSILARAPTLLIGIPLASFFAAMMLYSIKPMVFWRALAYLAVFHFIRQQYGFVRLYGRHDLGLFTSVWPRRLENATVYASMLYPLAYWHTKEARNYSWLIEGDFVLTMPPWLERASWVLYMALLVIYATLTLADYLWRRRHNAPKLLFVIGTALSWYVGIVAFNNDFAFTVTNVISHGIPYLALIWLVKNRELQTMRPPHPSQLLHKLLKPRWLLGFIAIPLGLAYGEEYLWDGLLWTEHQTLFPFSDKLPNLADSHLLLWIVPFLALPQMTHYLLDAFIWRKSMREV